MMMKGSLQIQTSSDTARFFKCINRTLGYFGKFGYDRGDIGRYQEIYWEMLEVLFCFVYVDTRTSFVVEIRATRSLQVSRCLERVDPHLCNSLTTSVGSTAKGLKMFEQHRSARIVHDSPGSFYDFGSTGLVKRSHCVSHHLSQSDESV